ncbi:MAG: phospholipase C type enzyme [Geoglossum umbratile]|nr:MAG: phospholipase C type enzyme [Geoglossum umbratile]
MAIDSSHPRINALTLNCWGLKYLAKHRNARLIAIGARIAASDPPLDIVGLQECWTQEDYRSIRQQTSAVLPYGKFYHSGIFGGGLAILSKWPIEESSMVRYSLNGRPTAFFRGDWFVGKGVACATLRMGPGQNDFVEVFNTHLHAPYEREPNDSYICHRTAQAWEITKLMRAAAGRNRLIIALGDFNMIPLSLAHRIITTHAPVQDAWRVLHPDSSIGAAIDDVEKLRNRPIPTAGFNLKENGATCDSVLNTWRWNKREQRRLEGGEDIVVDVETMDPRAKRLDYIFVGSGGPSLEAGVLDRGKWAVENVRVGMIERHPALKCSLSDHFSVEATLGWQQTDPAKDPDSPEEPSISSQERASPSELPLDLPAYTQILAMIRSYTRREYRQRRLRLTHFLLQLLIAIACLTGVWWSPHNYVSFILMLISSFGLAAGAVDGLIGGLFVGSELRALREFEWEIRNAMRRLGLGQGSGWVGEGGEVGDGEGMGDEM